MTHLVGSISYHLLNTYITPTVLSYPSRLKNANTNSLCECICDMDNCWVLSDDILVIGSLNHTNASYATLTAIYIPNQITSISINDVVLTPNSDEIHFLDTSLLYSQQLPRTQLPIFDTLPPYYRHRLPYPEDLNLSTPPCCVPMEHDFAQTITQYEETFKRVRIPSCLIGETTVINFMSNVRLPSRQLITVFTEFFWCKDGV